MMQTRDAQSRQSAKRFSSRWNWDSPTSLPAGEAFLQSLELGLPHPFTRRRVCPPPFGPGGGHTRLRLKGWGSPNSNEVTYTVVLYIYKYCTLCRDVSPRANICKCFKSQAIDSASLQYVACPAGTTNRVVVPARQAGNHFLGSLTVHKYSLCAGILEQSMGARNRVVVPARQPM
jgi:hypothetical protein